MRMFGLKELAGEKIGNVCQSLSECLTSTQLSMQILGYHSHVSWLQSQKAGEQELIFICSEVVWKPSWVVFFHPDLYFCDDSFFCSFFFQRMAESTSFALAGFSHPHCPHLWGQIPPGPAASHLTYRIRGCSGHFKGRKKSQMHIEILVAWACLCVRHDKFSIRDLWCFYSCHKKRCSVASRSRLWVSPGMKFPQRVNKSFSQALGNDRDLHPPFPESTGLAFSRDVKSRSALWSHMELPVWAIAQRALYKQGSVFTLCGRGTCTQAKKQNINFIACHISFPRCPPASLCQRSYKTSVLCQNTGDQQDFKAWFITHRTSKEKSQFPELLFLISAF